MTPSPTPPTTTNPVPAPGAAPAPVRPRRSWRWVLFKWLIGLLVLVALLASAYLFFVLNWSYSSGERAGWVQRLSHKGWFCKTWEGELAMVSMPGTAPEKFFFTVWHDEVAEQINRNMGKRVALHYEEKIGIPTTCFGETRYFVTKVTVVDQIPLAPGVVVPVPPPGGTPQHVPQPSVPGVPTAPTPPAASGASGSASPPASTTPDTGAPAAPPGTPAPGSPAPGSPAPGSPAPGSPAPGSPAPGASPPATSGQSASTPGAAPSKASGTTESAPSPSSQPSAPPSSPAPATNTAPPPVKPDAGGQGATRP